MIYAQLIDGRLIEFKQPKHIKIGTRHIFNPTAEECGYKPVIEAVVPELAEDEYSVKNYTETETEIVESIEVKKAENNEEE